LDFIGISLLKSCDAHESLILEKLNHFDWPKHKFIISELGLLINLKKTFGLSSFNQAKGNMGKSRNGRRLGWERLKMNLQN
jgi:hypothetical protein